MRMVRGLPLSNVGNVSKDCFAQRTSLGKKLVSEGDISLFSALVAFQSIRLYKILSFAVLYFCSSARIASATSLVSARSSLGVHLLNSRCPGLDALFGNIASQEMSSR